MKYAITLGQAYIITNNYIIINKGKLSDEEIKRLRELRDDLLCQSRWSERLYNNFKYLTQGEQKHV